MSVDPLKDRAQAVLEQLRNLHFDLERHMPPVNFDGPTILEGAMLVIADLVQLNERYANVRVLLDYLLEQGGEMGKAAKLLARQMGLSLEVFDPMQQDLILQTAGGQLWRVRGEKFDVRLSGKRAVFHLELHGWPIVNGEPGIVDRPPVKRDEPVTQAQLTDFAHRLRAAIAHDRTPLEALRDELTRAGIDFDAVRLDRDRDYYEAKQRELAEVRP